LITAGSPYSYTYTTASPATLNLSDLPATGTYTAVVYTAYGLPATAQLTLVAGATSTLPTTGVPQSDVATVAGQNIYTSFTATQGENLELTLDNASVPGASYNAFTVNIYNAAGSNVAGFTCYPGNPGASCSQPLWNLMAGTYTMVASPSWGGMISFDTLLEPDVLGSPLTAETPANISLAAGQAERLTFTGTLGGTVALQLSGVSTVPAGQYVYVAVYRPDTGLITAGSPYSYTYTTASPATLNLSNLPATGTYTAVVYTTYGLPATAQLTLAAGVTNTLSTTGTSQGIAANEAGQNVYLSFTATQGENLELTLDNASVAGASSNQFYVYVNNANGTNVASYSCYPANPGAGCTQPLWNLAAGTYSVEVVPNYGGTLQFNAILEPDAAGPPLTAGTPANISLAAGQAERLTFTGAVGGTVALQLSGVSTLPAGQCVYVAVYRPDTGLIMSGAPYMYTCTAAGPATLNLSNLPATGTYTVVVYTAYGLPATAQLNLVPSTSGTMSTTGSTGNFASTAAIPNVSLSFTANTGDNLELTLNNINAVGASTNGFEVNVYDPAGNKQAIFYCYASSPGASCTQSLWNLAAGTYTVVAMPVWGGTISFIAQLEPDMAEAALAANAPATVNLSGGQVERVTFAANAGDTVALQLSGVSTAPEGQSLSFSVYRPDVSTITTTNYYAQSGATDSNVLSLPNLPVGGTYTVVLFASNGIPASAQLTFIPP